MQYRWDYWLNAKTKKVSNPRKNNSGYKDEHADALALAPLYAALSKEDDNASK